MLAVLPDPKSPAEAHQRIQLIGRRQGIVSHERPRVARAPEAFTSTAPHHIMAVIARRYDLSPRDLIAKDYRRHVLAARVIAMRAVWSANPHLSYKALCRIFGRDYCVPLERSIRQKPLTGPALAPGVVDGLSTGVVRIIHQTAVQYGVPSLVIVGSAKSYHIVRARWAAIFAVRAARPGYSIPRIGRIFRRDHSTILHALEKMRADGVPQPDGTRIPFAEAAARHCPTLAAEARLGDLSDGGRG